MHWEFFFFNEFIMCGNNQHLAYEDTVNDITIFISPTEEYAIREQSIWDQDEKELIKNYKLIEKIRVERNSFGHSVSSYFSNDSVSTIGLEYYPEWKIDTNKYVKYVECIRAIFLKEGHCFVRIRKQYDEYKPLEDYEWAMSFENTSLQIKKPFKAE